MDPIYNVPFVVGSIVSPTPPILELLPHIFVNEEHRCGLDTTDGG